MDRNITPAVKVMDLFLLMTSIIAVIARGTTKALIVRSRSLDDYFIVLSLVSFICDLYCKCNMIVQLMWSANSAFQHWTVGCCLLPD